MAGAVRGGWLRFWSRCSKSRDHSDYNVSGKPIHFSLGDSRNDFTVATNLHLPVVFAPRDRTGTGRPSNRSQGLSRFSPHAQPAKMGLSPSAARGQVRVFGLRVRKNSADWPKNGPVPGRPVNGYGVQLKISGEVILGPAADEDNAARLRCTSGGRNAGRRFAMTAPSTAGPRLAWAQRSFIQPQVMVEERYLYDPVAGKYTVDRYLDDLETRYGGIDSVLIWPVYPNIGIDNRNQHDLLHDMPGGLPGLRQMVADFHRRGVRVLFPVMPWDVGTRPEGVPLCVAAARDMKAIGADGINGDTMGGMGREFRKAADDCGHPLVLEPENQLSDDGMVAWNNMSWGYWQYQPVPVVSKYKWIEPRHMVNVCERWAQDRTDGLQSAFFNGVGYESWENVWGIWNQLTPRDAEILRRIAMIERAMADLLVSPDWQPHFPTLQAGAGVYASRFPGKGRTCGCWSIAATRIPRASNFACRRTVERVSTTSGTGSTKPAVEKTRPR